MSLGYKGIIAVVSGVAGLVGLGYGLCSLENKTKKNSTTNKTTSGQVAVDVMCDTVHDTTAQADAAVVDTVNAIRINHLLKELDRIDNNKAGAEEEIRLLKAEVQRLLITNRGGVKGIHGFIGESSQVHVANIKAFINGNEPLYILLDDNSMTDYTRGIENIQQKACQAGGYLGLDSIKRHKAKYPEFVESGGKYQIPKDMFTRYKNLKNLPENVALKLRKDDLRLWKYIRYFTEENPDITIEPMEVTYSDIQAGNINNTVKRVEDETNKEFEKQHQTAQKDYAPNIAEFLKICGISATIEGGMNAGTEFVQKLKSGKKITEFTLQDYKDIGGKFVSGSGKGAFRGGMVYIVTNIYKIPAAVISGVITVAFGLCREGYLLFKKKISTDQFKKNSIFVVLETIASTSGAALGKHWCKKHPIIGSLSGSIIGSAIIGCIRRTAFSWNYSYSLALVA